MKHPGNGLGHSLSTLPAETPIHHIPAQRIIILVQLQRAIAVLDLDLVGLDQEIGSYV